MPQKTFKIFNNVVKIPLCHRNKRPQNITTLPFEPVKTVSLKSSSFSCLFGFDERAFVVGTLATGSSFGSDGGPSTVLSGEVTEKHCLNSVCSYCRNANLHPKINVYNMHKCTDKVYTQWFLVISLILIIFCRLMILWYTDGVSTVNEEIPSIFLHNVNVLVSGR